MDSSMFPDLEHAAAHAQLALQVARELFPNAGGFFALSLDQKRIVYSEVVNLLLVSRWHVQSAFFADRFALLAPAELAPAGLGQVPPARSPSGTTLEPAPQPAGQGEDTKRLHGGYL